MKEYDLIVIGAGPGGYEAAIKASSKYGMKTALIEKNQLGGTCLNRGCIPTKTMLHTVELYDAVKRHGASIGLTGVETYGCDLKVIQMRKNEVLNNLRSGIAAMMKKDHIDIYDGFGEIVSPCSVRVKSDSKTIELKTRYIMIATGSHPSIPTIMGCDLPGVITSDELLSLDRVPSKLIIIGGGVIGIEFASIFSSLGSDVTVIEAMPRIIPNMDKEISQKLKVQLKRTKGVNIHTSASVNSIKLINNGLLSCSYTENGHELTDQGELVLVSVGRKAFTEGLIADDAVDSVRSINMEKGAISVNDKFETNISGIYAIGDVIGGIQLAHAATAEGYQAIDFMNGNEPSVDLGTIPSCIYTNPEIASVGISPEYAKEHNIDIITKKYPMGANGKSVLTFQDNGFVKIIVDSKTQRVLGASMMCARATDMITHFSLAVLNNLTLHDIGKVIYPHPTFCEGIGEAAR